MWILLFKNLCTGNDDTMEKIKIVYVCSLLKGDTEKNIKKR